MNDEMKQGGPGKNPGSFRQRLDDYLADRMSPEERNAFEQEMQDDPFYADAAEGIDLSGHTGLGAVEHEINKGLKKQLAKKKNKKRKRPEMQLSIIAVILILLLLLISFLLIRNII